MTFGTNCSAVAAVVICFASNPAHFLLARLVCRSIADDVLMFISLISYWRGVSASTHKTKEGGTVRQDLCNAFKEKVSRGITFMGGMKSVNRIASS